ncbi:MAG: hypothetical protein HY222_04930 [Thaumarchaeota archaeon]|nr:hypothetical protein [Nitrososphaerota archaeon]MBI3641719.1 hypothetical protein [Nitrososphaerota archaeon]
MKEKKSKYKEYLALNKNLFIAFVAAEIIAAITSQILSKSVSYLNTSITMGAEYSVYFSLFGLLYSIDNRKKYKIESGQTDWHRLRKDVIKIITSLGIGEIVYTVLRWFSLDYLLIQSYQPYLSSIVSASVSFAIYLLVVNLTVKATRLY